MMAPTYRMYTPPGSLFAFAPLVVSEYAGVSVEIISTDTIEETIVSKSPTGKAPMLETGTGEIIVSSLAIARFLANLRKDSYLLGERSDRVVAFRIEDWSNWAEQELELPVCASYYMATGCMRLDETNFFKAKQDIECALGVMEAHLENEKSNYLVLPEQVTLADIVIVCYLVYPLTLVFDDAELKQFPRMRKWFMNCVQQQEFRSILGKIECGKK